MKDMEQGNDQDAEEDGWHQMAEEGEWRQITREAKAHPGLWYQERR